MPLPTGLRNERTKVLNLTYDGRLTAFPTLFPFLQGGPLASMKKVLLISPSSCGLRPGVAPLRGALLLVMRGPCEALDSARQHCAWRCCPPVRRRPESVPIGEGDSLEGALRLTAWSDDLIGLTEHRGKRQLWTAAADDPDSNWVEHLDLRVKPRKTCLPETRTGPADVERLANVIAAAPGTALTRERFLLTFALPRLTWAAPYVPAVPGFLTASWRRALRPSSCTWWCAGRVWADSITVHPVFAATMACLREAARPCTKTELVVSACVRHHAATLGLSVYGMPPAFHLVLPPHDDPRLVAAFAQLAAQHQADPLHYRPDWDDGHLLCVTARVRALSRIKPTRADSQGAGDVDVEAQSHPAFTTWSRRLQGQDAAFLSVFRGGAVKTPTRRYW